MGPRDRNRNYEEVRRNLFDAFEDAANQNLEIAAAAQQQAAAADHHLENQHEELDFMPGIQPLPGEVAAEVAADLAEDLAALVIDEEPAEAVAAEPRQRKRPHNDDEEARKRPRKPRADEAGDNQPAAAAADAGIFRRQRNPRDDRDQPPAKRPDLGPHRPAR